MDEIRAFALLKALELEQINNSKLRSSITRERDPVVSKMEQDVFGKLRQFSIDNTPSINSTRQLPSDNKTLSPEEAIKELEEMEKKGII